ncbi:MAG: MBL fold metallo-hydrolase, partial [Bacillus sp. (in: firmicutes)]
MIVWKDENTTIFKSVLYETISTVVITDDCVLVVDPCWLPHEVEEIRSYVEAHRQLRPLYLLFTHSDYDHIIGYRAFPEATVIASEAFKTKSDQAKAGIIEQIKAFDDEYYVTRSYEIVYPEVDLSIAGEETSIEIGQTKLTFFQAPGHNEDGIFTIIEPLGVFLTGDYFSDIEFPYIYVNSYKYEETILKLDSILSEYPIELFVSGDVNASGDRSEMKKRQRDSLDYIHMLRELVVEKNQ